MKIRYILPLDKRKQPIPLAVLTSTEEKDDIQSRWRLGSYHYTTKQAFDGFIRVVG